MKLTHLFLILLFPLFTVAQTPEQKAPKTKQKSQWINWGTWTLGLHFATAHVHNLYSFSNKSDFSVADPVDAKYSATVFYFKVENITRFIYWNVELGLPFSNSVHIENETDPIFNNFEGKARFGRMINIPISFGGFIGRRFGLWTGYNYSLFYLASTKAAFTGSGGYAYTERFMAGDMGILNGHGVNFHAMLALGKKSLLRFTIAANAANKRSVNVKGSAVVSEFQYFIAFNKNKLSNGLMIRYQSATVKVTEHPLLARFNDEPTICRSSGLSIGLCFDLPEGTIHRNSDIHK